MTAALGNPMILANGRCVLRIGDAFDALAEIGDETVDLVVMSPPYWGLRDYGTAFWAEGDPECDHIITGATRTPWANKIKGPGGGRTIAGFRESYPARHIGGRCLICGARRVDYQIGLEQTLGQHIEVMLEVFDELRRVLKPHGSIFMNYGDCYATAPNGRSASATKAAGSDDRTFRDKPFSTVGPVLGAAHGLRYDPKRRMAADLGRYDPNYATARGLFEGNEWNERGYGTRRIDHGGRVIAGGFLKDKDLVLAGARIAIALQEDGWWVRSENIWAKKNPMPDSSGTGRPSVAFEKVYIFAKSADADVWRARDDGDVSFGPDMDELVPMPTRPTNEDGSPNLVKRWRKIGGYYNAAAVMQPSSPNSQARAAKSGSAPATKGTTTKVAQGTRNNPSYNAAMMTRDRKKRGTDPVHVAHEHTNNLGLENLGRGVGRLLRNFENAPVAVWEIATEPFKEAHYATFPPELVARCIAAGSPPDNGVVLDPFAGAGTTGLVALRMGRRAHLIELNPESAEIARKRIERDLMGPEEKKRAIAAEKPKTSPGPLFQEAAE